MAVKTWLVLGCIACAAAAAAEEEVDIVGDLDAGSGAPPAPPPPFEAPLVFGLKATGDVADYGIVAQAALKAKFAIQAGVQPGAVSVNVTGGSVIIQIVIDTDSLSKAKSAAHLLESVTSSAALATKFLQGTPGLPSGFSVEQITQTPQIYAPPSAPGAHHGLNGGQIAGIVIGVIAGVAIIGGGGYYYYTKRSSQPLIYQSGVP